MAHKKTTKGYMIGDKEGVLSTRILFKYGIFKTKAEAERKKKKEQEVVEVFLSIKCPTCKK